MCYVAKEDVPFIFAASHWSMLTSATSLCCVCSHLHRPPVNWENEACSITECELGWVGVYFLYFCITHLWCVEVGGGGGEEALSGVFAHLHRRFHRRPWKLIPADSLTEGTFTRTLRLDITLCNNNCLHSVVGFVSYESGVSIYSCTRPNVSAGCCVCGQSHGPKLKIIQFGRLFPGTGFFYPQQHVTSVIRKSGNVLICLGPLSESTFQG